MKYRTDDGIVERTIRKQLILVPVMNGIDALDSLYTLNETGTVIWQSIKDGLSERETVQRLVDVYDVEEQEAMQDLQSILTDLQEIGIIEPQDES